MNGDGDVIKMRKLGYYSFVHNKELYEAYDTYRVIRNLSESGFKDDNFAIIQADSGGLSNNGKRAKRQRSSLVESVVNNNIDSAFNSMR